MELIVYVKLMNGAIGRIVRFIPITLIEKNILSHIELQNTFTNNYKL